MNTSRIVARLLFAGLFTLSLGAQAAEPAAKPAAKPAAAKPAAAKSGKAAAKPAEKPEASKEMSPEVVAAMNKLVKVAMLQVSEELEKGVDDFLPYGLLELKSGELKTVKWMRANPPAPFEVMRGIVLTMRQQAQKNPDIVAGVVVAPSAVPTTEGIQVRTIRIEVDHRDGEPRLVMIPYMRQDGKIVTEAEAKYLPATNPLFARPGDQPPAAAPATPATPAAPAATKKP